MKEDKEFDYINVIPLVDVMLVLLTIVLTTSTFIATGAISVSLPKASPHGRAAVTKTQTVSIDTMGRIFFNSEEVGLTGLSAHLLPLDRETPLLVRADCDIRLQVFIDVLDILNAGSFKKVAIQTQAKR
jgi:biopolymer transport protein ExbD